MNKYQTMTLHMPHVRDFSVARNKMMHDATAPWILFLDTDETLVGDIPSTLDPAYGAYRLKRFDIFLGKKLRYGELYDAAHIGIIRLVQPTYGTWKGKVHERFVTTHPVGEIATAHIVHHAHKDVASFLRKINMYSSLRAEELLKEKKSRYILTLQMILYPFGKFWYTFIWKQGFRDGPEGFIYAFLMAFHSFLVRAKALVYVA